MQLFVFVDGVFIKHYLQQPTTNRVFGQYKIHKDRLDGKGHPIRLITSTVKSVSYNTSKELASILAKAYNRPKHTIKNARAALNVLQKNTPSTWTQAGIFRHGKLFWINFNAAGR